MPSPAPSSPLLLFVVTEDWYFYSHRLPMARAAMAAGYTVAVATRVTAHRQRIEAEGIRVIPLHRLDRQSTNPLAELAAIGELVRLYRREKPFLLHHVALKPVLYGSVAAWLAGIPRVVNAMAGLGSVFVSHSPGMKLLKPAVTAAFRFLLNRKGSHLLVQNPDDRQFFIENRLVSPQTVTLIPGSGVDIAAFAPSPEPAGEPVALFVARLLWAKGVGELVEAARILRQRQVPLRIRIAGDGDRANPDCVPDAILEQWRTEGVVELLGRRDDIASLWRQASVAVLPSYYREGLPKSLLEGAASGRPLVTADSPGCRALVHHRYNGLVVPPRDAVALADALQQLAEDPALRRQLGDNARRDCEELYSEQAIGERIVALYRSLSS